MNQQHSKVVYALLMGLMLLASCHKADKQESENNTGITVKGDEVEVNASSPIAAKLKVEQVKQGDYTLQSTTTGTVEPITGQLAEVASPFEGRITKSYIRLGQHVSKGAALFEISSSDYLESVKAYLAAKQSKQLSEKNYRRKKELSERGIASAKEFEEAESDYRIAEKELDKAAATLKIYNVKGEDADLGRPLVVRSPIAGEIVKTKLVVGAYQKVDDASAVTVADLNQVWVVARVKEKNIGQVNPNDDVEVVTESAPNSPIRGKVDYIGNIMDEQTRSVEVYIRCNNTSRALKPGMFVTSNFEHKQHNAIVIPSSAVLQQENKSYVFVQLSKNHFEKREVSVSTAGADKQIVHAGLESGSTIVVEGGIYLR